jgi:hypothetical protein
MKMKRIYIYISAIIPLLTSGAEQTSAATYSVPAATQNSNWTNVIDNAISGISYTFEVSGMWSIETGVQISNGSGDPNYRYYNVYEILGAPEKNVVFSSLIATLVGYSPGSGYFNIGDGTHSFYNLSGKVQIGMWDTNSFDNSGSLTVRVTSVPAPIAGVGLQILLGIAVFVAIRRRYLSRIL